MLNYVTSKAVQLYIRCFFSGALIYNINYNIFISYHACQHHGQILFSYETEKLKKKRSKEKLSPSVVEGPKKNLHLPPLKIQKFH